MARNVSATIAELRVEHERLQSILRSMLEGVLVTDLTGSVVLMNERARDLLELRTPLTAIKGYAETLLGPAGDERPTARRFLTVIDRHAERLGRLIDDLLTLSDLELGRTPLRLAAVELAPVLDDVLAIFAE